MSKRFFHMSLKIGVILVVTVLVARFAQHKTKGFKMSLIDCPLQENTPFKASFLSLEEKANLDGLLKHPFYFLGKGGQFYVFLSQDHTTVLKFFKKKHPLPDQVVQWIENLLPEGLKGYRFKLLKTRKEMFFNIFQSCEIAHERLKKESGLIYVHLSPTPQIWSKVEIVDNLGISHGIDLDSTAFVIQKKADLVFDKIQRQFNQGDIEGVKNSISSLFELISKRSSLGILDNDNGLKRNYGYIEDKAVCIDVGSLSLEESLKEGKIAQKELQKKTKKLRKWLAEFHPELLFYYDEQMNAKTSAAPAGFIGKNSI